MCCYQIDSTLLSIESIAEYNLEEDLKNSTVIEIFAQKFYDHFYVLMTDGVLLKFDLNLEFISKTKITKKACKIISAKINPIEDNLMVFFEDGFLISFNKTFEQENEVNIFEGINSESIVSGNIAWRLDSKFISLSFKTTNGTKIYSFSSSLSKIQSNSLFNPEYDLVRNVFEKPDLNLKEINSWATNGSAIYGVFTSGKEKKVDDHIVCWEVNGLIYKRFELPNNFKGNHTIEQITFNSSFDTMAIISSTIQNNFIWLFLRSNANWYIKSKVQLPSKNSRIIHYGKTIIVSGEKKLSFMQFTLKNDLFDYQKDGLINQQNITWTFNILRAEHIQNHSS